MKKQIIQKEFNNRIIEFETGNNLMVNATQMAKLFDKNLTKFTQSDHAKDFIKSCIKLPYGSLSEINSDNLFCQNIKTFTIFASNNIFIGSKYPKTFSFSKYNCPAYCGTVFSVSDKNVVQP